jgi:hypothetical protein
MLGRSATSRRGVYGAPTRAITEAAIDVFAEKYGAKYEKEVASASPARPAHRSAQGSSTYQRLDHATQQGHVNRCVST